MLDPVTGKERRAYSGDIANIARLVDDLPGYDVFSVATLAEDAPLEYFAATRVCPAIQNCRRSIRVSASSLNDAAQLVEFGILVAGSQAAYRERPFITHHYCPIVSPLTFDFDSTDEIIYFPEQNLPSYCTVVPNGGMSSPLTLLGTLVQANAEFLAYATLTQMIHPGKELIYSTLPTIPDMRRGAYAPGAIENGMLVMGAVQMAKLYNVPSAGYLGLTNAKINDAQSGYEAGMFIDKPQTYELMKETMLLTDISDRDPRCRWEKFGALDAQERGLRKAFDILAHDHASLLSQEEEVRLRTVFASLPRGECSPLSRGEA